jgi:hypothetical protein
MRRPATSGILPQRMFRLRAQRADEEAPTV